MLRQIPEEKSDAQTFIDLKARDGGGARRRCPVPCRVRGTAGGFGLNPQLCPENYNPVICSDGVVYGNACFAAQAHATGCVPYATPL